MPHNSAFADETALNFGGFVNRAQQGLSTGAVPEPDASEGVLGGPGGFHNGQGAQLIVPMSELEASVFPRAEWLVGLIRELIYAGLDAPHTRWCAWFDTKRPSRGFLQFGWRRP